MFVPLSFVVGITQTNTKHAHLSTTLVLMRMTSFTINHFSTRCCNISNVNLFKVFTNHSFRYNIFLLWKLKNRIKRNQIYDKCESLFHTSMIFRNYQYSILDVKRKVKNHSSQNYLAHFFAHIGFYLGEI